MVYNTDPLSFHWISKGYESPFSTSGFWYRNYFVADLVPKIRISWDRIKLLIIVGYIYIYIPSVYIYICKYTHTYVFIHTMHSASAAPINPGIQTQWSACSRRAEWRSKVSDGKDPLQ